jgi:hypothetical protein
MKKRIMCRNMHQMLEGERYSSHNGPEPRGVKGYTMNGRKAQKPNAEATS